MHLLNNATFVLAPGPVLGVSGEKSALSCTGTHPNKTKHEKYVVNCEKKCNLLGWGKSDNPNVFYTYFNSIEQM